MNNNDESKTKDYRFISWIISMLLFIPINLYVGLGVFISGYNIFYNIHDNRFSFSNEGMSFGFIVSLLFIMFNLFYCIHSFKNIKKYSIPWTITSPIVISFVQFTGCIPVLMTVRIAG
ncbi:hypothetical protein [Marinicellulosiphila megalodicopiae]|uniref:hypothetical protein n=1 Tax=Marinicellulosiphila megalodicopiae TaxID=2724896 RepID=UPI003BAF3D29